MGLCSRCFVGKGGRRGHKALERLVAVWGQIIGGVEFIAKIDDKISRRVVNCRLCRRIHFWMERREGRKAGRFEGVEVRRDSRLYELGRLVVAGRATGWSRLWCGMRGALGWRPSCCSSVRVLS